MPIEWTFSIVELHKPLRRLEPLIITSDTLEEACQTLMRYLEEHKINTAAEVTLRIIIDGVALPRNVLPGRPSAVAKSSTSKS